MVKRIFSALVFLLSLNIHAQNAGIRLGLPLGHTDGIKKVTYSPDGKTIATASLDNTAIIWDAETGKLMNLLKGHEAYLNSVVFSPDGKTLLTASNDSTAKAWDVERGILLYSLEGNTSGVYSAIYSPDGSTVLTYSGNTARIWDSKNGKLLRTLEGHELDITSIGYSPDGTFIITASLDKTAKIWDSHNGSLVRTLAGHATNLMSAAFSPDGKYIVTLSFRGEVKIWNSENGELIRTLDDIGSSDLVISPDSRTFLLLNGSEANIFDLSSGRLLHTLKGHSELISSAEFSPDGSNIATVSNDYTVKIWDLRSGTLLHTLGEENISDKLNWNMFYLQDATFSPDGNTVAVASSQGIVKIWVVISGKCLLTLGGHTMEVRMAFFSPDGKYIVSYSFGIIPPNPWNHIRTRIWEMETGRLINEFRGETFPGYMSSDNKIIIRDSTYEFLYDAISGQLLDTLYVLFGEKLIFSDDGSKLAVTNNNDNSLWIKDVRSGYYLQKLIGHAARISSVDFSPDGNMLATGSEDGTARLWDVNSGQLLHEFTGFQKELIFVIFSPDGKNLGAFSRDNMKIWNVNTGLTLDTIPKYDKWFTLPGQSPDGKYFLTASTDGSFGLKDATTGEMIFQHFVFDEKEILTLHSSGLFDATPGAMELMYWVKGLDVIELNQLKDRYWEPGLWEKVMNGEPLRNVRGMNDLKLQPEVELGGIIGGELPVTLTKRDGGYGKVTIMINGKEVAADARGSSFDKALAEQTIYFDLKDNPLLQQGKENTITVRAWSEDGFVEGRGVNILYIPEGDTDDQPPALFAMVLGVSEYASDIIRLNYAEPDASAIAQAFQMGGENLFGKDHTLIYRLTRPGKVKPTKENIRNVFAEIKEKAKPGDILLLYMSGHGITWGGEAGDFYYLTSDAYTASSESYNDPVIRSRNTISTMEFTEWIKEIPALKQVMIIDACGSGKAVDNLLAQRSVDPSQIKSIDRMKDRTGMFIISGCAADAVSYEASRYGQGLLTYTILQAMKGGALREDKYVDVNTILNYARVEVSNLAAGIGGIQQPQLMIPKGGSFDIGMMEEKDKSRVPLSNPRPLFVRSTFLDADQLEDVIGLSVLVDNLLSSISSKGAESPLIFLDARTYPDGCKVSGTYNQQGGKITLRYKIKCGEKVREYLAEGDTVEDILALIKGNVLLAE